MTPPLGDIAHVGHAGLLTPDLEGSVGFCTDYLGLTVNGQDGDSVYLRTFEDYEHHSLVLTAAGKPGLRPTTLRTSSEEALDRRVTALEATGRTGRWAEEEPDIGKLYLTADPDGHEIACTGRASTTRRPRSSGRRFDTARGGRRDNRARVLGRRT